MVGRRRRTALMIVSILCLVPVVACSSEQAEPDTAEQESALVSAINHQLELRPGRENLRAVLVDVHGKPKVAQYADVPASRHWDMGWGTVAVVATLVGIAIDEGRIPGLDATLRQLLPDDVDDMSPAVASTTLREVLTMTGGFQKTLDDPVADYMAGPDPVGRILRAARPNRAHRFAYSSQGAHVLAAIVAKATGMPLLDYARSRLFDPLGIKTDAASGFAWAKDSTGLNLGWTSLKLAPEDVARIGQLYLDGGRWKGRQVVSESWVHEATRVQEENVARPNDSLSGYGGYGYGWWLIESDHSPAFFVADLSGQLLEVLPTHSLVAVVSSEPGPEGGPGLTPDSLTFLVNDVIGPGVRR
jgi:CubicO group peptidase (beta-lactamase class C family)